MTRRAMMPVSLRAMTRIWELRKVRGLSARALAEQITASGYPVSADVIAQYENRRRRTVPVEYVVHAAEVLGVAVGPLLSARECPGCHGRPPDGFTCNMCGEAGREAADAEM